MACRKTLPEKGEGGVKKPKPKPSPPLYDSLFGSSKDDDECELNFFKFKILKNNYNIYNDINCRL